MGEFLLVLAYPGSPRSTAVKPCCVCVIVFFSSVCSIMVLIVCLNGRHIVALKMSYWLIHSSHRLATTLLH